MATVETTVGFSRIRAILANVPFLVVLGALIFWPAGTLSWLRGWCYVVLIAGTFAVTGAYLMRVNPAMVDSRTRIHSGTKRWDIVWACFFGPLFFGTYVIAGFDARFGWSAMTLWLWPVGLAVFAPATALFVRAMAENPFFEKTVRIQTERGHPVIDSGPYRHIRHPGYVGFAGWCASAPLFLGSWWAFVPAALAVVAVVIRTALEDRTLRAELPGYADYAARVRHRLVPGVW